MHIIPQEREAHKKQLADTVRRIFPCLGYSQEAMDQFIQMPDEDGDVEGEYYRIETAEDQGVLVKVRTGSRWYVSYLIPIDWESRYYAISSAIEWLKSACREKGTGDMWFHIRKNLPSHQAYYEGLLAMQGFRVRPRVHMIAPLEVLDTLERPEIPENIIEIAPSKDRLREIADNHYEALMIYEGPLPLEEEKKKKQTIYNTLVSWFPHEDVKTWVVLEHRGRIIGLCQGLVSLESHSLDLWEVGLHPDYQGRGLGRYMCIRSMQKLREYYGGPEMHFAVDAEPTPSSIPALKLYYGLGFTIDRHESYVDIKSSKAS